MTVYTLDMLRRQFLGTMAASLLQAQPAGRPPNILFILADDLGYGDLGCYGQRLIATPNIDRMAAEGVRFTQAYAGCTVCAPSRCSLMTGLHTGHTRIRGNARVPLAASDVTVAKVLKTAGYRTAVFGKWGLGNAGTAGAPNRQGFDEWFGYLDQQHAHSYYPELLFENENEFIVSKNLGVRSAYSHDLFTARALSFLERQQRDPFFLYLAYTIPHANDELGKDTGNGMEVPSDAPYSNRDWPQVEKNFAAMITRMDRDIGKIMSYLKASGVDKNTLVLFSSDNGAHREGGHDPRFFQSSGPLRGIKRDLYEGGIRVPMVARWPGRIRPGRVSEQVWGFWDFLPTAAELAGVHPPTGLDGISILPALMGQTQRSHEYLYWEFHERGFAQAVRMGDWKAMRFGSRGPLELYNLRDDTAEKNNMAAAQPAIVGKIEQFLKTARSDSPDFPVRERSDAIFHGRSDP